MTTIGPIGSSLGSAHAQVLKRAGYATAVAGKWQLSLMKNDLQQPARVGFDEWSVFGWHEGARGVLRLSEVTSGADQRRGSAL